MARYHSIPAAAKHFRKHTRTLEIWIGNGFIHSYRAGSRTILGDLDKIERAFKTNPRMRDGRKPFGDKAKIVPLPIVAEGLSPSQISRASQKKCWWNCPAGHSYDVVVAVRTNNRQGCPYCSGRRVLSGVTDLATVQQGLAGRWHPTLNGSFTPDQAHPGSAKRIWWTRLCEIPYQAEIRVMREDRYCRSCSSKTGHSRQIN